MAARGDRRGRVAVLAGAAAMAVLSGCGSGSSAATVGARVISDATVQQVTGELQAGEATSSVTPQLVLHMLMLEPYVAQYAEQEGVSISESGVTQALQQAGIQEASQATRDAFRTNVELGSLSPMVIPEVLDELENAEVEVNPRYGEFVTEPNQTIEQFTPDWIDAPSAPNPVDGGTTGSEPPPPSPTPSTP